MAIYYRIPTLASYLPYLLIGAAFLSLFPYMICLDFSTPEFEEVCPVTWQKRTGQSGALLMYFSAVIGVLSLYWQSKVDRNLLTAETEIARLQRIESRYKRVVKRTGMQSQALKETQQQLSHARDRQSAALAFPSLVRVAGWFAIVLTFAGTVMQVVETGA